MLRVILAGGSGTRLWPLSRNNYPKQFLKLSGENTLFQEAILRLAHLETQKPIVICNNEHRFLAAEQINQINASAEIILEPVGRNTAPAIALAALKAIETGNDPLLLVLAADHLIQDVETFEIAVKAAQTCAQQGKLVTFGIVADAPETGYGYIKRGASCELREDGVKNLGTGAHSASRGILSEELGNRTKGLGAFVVDRFVEKPNLEKAQEYLDSGEYYWNSGMFLFKASRYLAELEKFFPEILVACKKSMAAAESDLDFIRIDETAFSECPSESIDYAVMEKTDSAVVVPLDAGWSDIGSWSAIWDVSEKDEFNNVTQGDVIAFDSSNCFVHGGDRLVSILGLDDIVIVDTKDTLLVANKSHVQAVKKIVDQLKKSDREEWKIHREVYRPWGKYDSIDFGERYQVKRITVKPGAKLSVQMHHHRAEHWVVVSGTASVTNGENTFLVSENESTYIPIGQIHALENPGKVALELIEVQTGSYLGEDDIVRFEDNYGRV